MRVQARQEAGHKCPCKPFRPGRWGSVPADHVHADGQMTVRRSWLPCRARPECHAEQAFSLLIRNLNRCPSLRSHDGRCGPKSRSHGCHPLSCWPSTRAPGDPPCGGDWPPIRSHPRRATAQALPGAGCLGQLATDIAWLYRDPVWGEAAVMSLPTGPPWAMSSGTRCAGARLVIAATAMSAAWSGTPWRIRWRAPIRSWRQEGGRRRAIRGGADERG